MTYKEAREQLIWNLRLDFEPVGVRYIFNEDEIEQLPVTHKAKAKITYCQFLTAVRQERYALFLEPNKCLCGNASLVFGFREINQESDTKAHLKYLVDPEVAWRAPQEKEKLELGKCKGIYMAPLDWYDKHDHFPDIVYIMSTPYQAYHILNDYMGAQKVPNLTFFHTPNSAVCSGSVYAYNKKTTNMTTMCAGSKTSGKTEMGYVNLFIPGEHIIPTVEQQKMRCEQGGPSVLGKGFKPWPGLDVCKGCPLFKFEPVDKNQK